MAPSRSMALSALAAVVAVVLAVGPRGADGAAQKVIEDTFDNIKNSATEQMVAFYHSSDASHESALKAMRKAAKKIRREMPEFLFRKCDCDLSINRKECSEASFNSGTFLFTSTANEGIEKYTLAVDGKTIASYLRGKKAPHNDFNDVVQFTSEDALWERMDLSDSPKPVLVKFYEQWCQHCKRARLPFAQGATHFKRRVEFMDVECSKNDDTTAFCTRNSVKSYPTFILFTGEKKIPFSAEVRHIMTFGKFFDEHIPEEKAKRATPSVAAADAPATPAAPAAAATPKPAAAAVPAPPMGDFSKPSATANAAPSAPASAGAGAASNQEVEQLKRQVKALESRLAKVEAMLQS